MCKSIRSASPNNTPDLKHSLYYCLSQFMILEYIRHSRSRDVNDSWSHCRTYLHYKWLRLGPKLTERIRNMGLDKENEIPAQYR